MLIQEASITGVLRTLLILLALYFAVRILGRLLKPILNADSKKPTGNAEFRSDLRKEGEVRIEYPNKKPSANKNKNKPGDYIDFEEVD